MIILKNLQKIHHEIAKFIADCDKLLIAISGDKTEKRMALRVPQKVQVGIKTLKKEIVHYNFIFHSDEKYISAKSMIQYRLVVVPSLKKAQEFVDAIENACAKALIDSLNKDNQLNSNAWVNRMKILFVNHKKVKNTLTHWHIV